MARINLWTFALPGLAERREDIEPNLDYELEQFASTGGRVRMSRQVRQRFLKFAKSPQSKWRGNFRDLNAAVRRMATLADAGRISTGGVEEEISRLNFNWNRPASSTDDKLIEAVIGEQALLEIDPFDRPQLANVIRICQSSATMAEAGKKLFSVSRSRKANPNDSDRLRKYLTRFGVDWKSLRD